MASTAARDWANARTDTAAIDLGTMLVGRFPVMGSVEPSLVAEEIRAVLKWSFSSPVPTKNRGRYHVIVTASARPRIDAPRLPTKAYDISARYDLTVDTQSGKVIGYELDMSLVTIEDRSAFLGDE